MSTSRATRLSAAVAVVAALASVSPLLGAVPALAAEAPLPSALTIKSEVKPDPRAGYWKAGETGYVTSNASDYFWNPYAGGAPKLIEPRPTRGVEADGSDSLVLRYPDREVVRDMKTGAEFVRPGAPAGHKLLGYVGKAVVSLGSDGKVSFTEVKDGAPTSREILADAKGWAGSRVGTTGLLVPGKGGNFLIGPDGTVRPTKFPELNWPEYQQQVIWGEGHFLVHPKGMDGANADEVQYWDLAKDLDKPQAVLGGVKIGGESDVLGVVGKDLIMSRRGADVPPPAPCDGQCDDFISRTERPDQYIFDIIARPLAGGPERVIARKSSARPNMTADGRLILSRDTGTDTEAYALRAAADGSSGTTALRRFPYVGAPVQLALAHGTLSSRETAGDDSVELVERKLTVGAGAVSSGPRTPRRDEGAKNTDSGWIATGSGDLVRAEDAAIRVLKPDATGKPSVPDTYAVPGMQKDTLQARGRHAVYRVKNPDGSLKIVRHSITDSGVDQRVPPQKGSRPAPAFGLGDDRVLWVESTTDGVVNVIPHNVSGTPSRTVDVADCDLTDIQVVGKDLYWKCGTKAAGVFDTVANAPVAALPAHDSALLADGYVAWEKDGNLSVTALRGTPSTRPVGRPADKRPGFGWTVDRFGGALAYVDAGKNIQIVKSGVPASPMYAPEGFGAQNIRTQQGSWAGRWLLSKPASSWKLTFTHKLTGRVVKTITGKEARYSIGAQWDGIDPSTGKPVILGTYEWKLTAVPADGAGAPLSVSGKASAGVKNWVRDLAGDYHGDLLAFTPEGRADVRPGSAAGKGTFEAPVSGNGWTGANAVTAAVPIADVDYDGCSDVVVRHPSGELRVYLPGCTGVLTPKNPYKVVGGGWNMYDQIVSPGNLIGDSRPDLLAKTPDGDLFLYESYGKEGKFKSRVRVSTGFRGYLLVGGHTMGTKEGRTALIARDPSGKLFRYDALGGGKWAPRVMIGTGGWNTYTAIVGVPDLHGDYPGELVARDKAGRLWRYDGKPDGTLSSAVDIGGGWNMYKSLY
ncbi:hypothetical protein [Streptomyces sp. TBY4]|uniref:hypothetical protein n=1 Tax=Streptomyces sp. TBY4 TaxID=2962030 RepID=UPI0020B655F1|nr:hypothetical protein [Streptomyces sp. TBY4]MCP3755342.1 hypothetical protein [Streptomyces sp. TBY4]